MIKKILISIALGVSFFSARPIHASIFGDIKNGLLYLPAYIFYGIAYATSAIANLIISFLGWVITAGSLLSYTRPADNPIIKTGFDVTLSLVNMILVMALIFIALTTILRLKEYETKRLLTRFIIIALIVNFSPVICGLVVDASNIVTNYFLTSVGSGTGKNATIPNAIWGNPSSSCGAIASTVISREKSKYNNNMWGADANSNLGVGEVMADCTMQSIIYVIIAFIYLLFTLLFLARIFAIWILVILSPIAFACAVLPFTKKYWDEWLDNFIKWCTIGMTGGFFLWLGGVMASGNKMTEGAFATFNTSTGPGLYLLQYVVAIIFLVVGFSYALKTGLSGASAISGFVGGLAGGFLGATIAGAKGTAKWTGKQAAKQTLGRAATSDVGRRALSSITQGTWGGDTLKQSGNRFVRGIGHALGAASWASRKAGAAGINASTVSQETAIAKLEGEYKTKYGDNAQAATAIYRSFGPTQQNEKIAMARHLSKIRGGFGSLPIPAQRQAIQLAARNNPGSVGGLIRSNPQMILDPTVSRILRQMPEGQRPFGGRPGTAIHMENVIPRMNSDNFKNLNRGNFDINNMDPDPATRARIRATSERFLDSLSENGSGAQIKSFVDEQGRDAAASLEQNLRSMATRLGYADPTALLAARNPRLLAYLQSPSGQGLITL